MSQLRSSNNNNNWNLFEWIDGLSPQQRLNMLLCVLKMLTSNKEDSPTNLMPNFDNQIHVNPQVSSPLEEEQISSKLEKQNKTVPLKQKLQKSSRNECSSPNNKITKRNRNNIRKRYQTLVLSFFNEPFKIQTVESMKSKFASKTEKC